MHTYLGFVTVASLSIAEGTINLQIIFIIKVEKQVPNTRVTEEETTTFTGLRDVMEIAV